MKYYKMRIELLKLTLRNQERLDILRAWATRWLFQYCSRCAIELYKFKVNTCCLQY